MMPRICVSRETSYTGEYNIELPVRAAAICVLIVLTACGAGGSRADAMYAMATLSGDERAATATNNRLMIMIDEYGLQTPNFYYTTDNEMFWSIQNDVSDSGTVYDSVLAVSSE